MENFHKSTPVECPKCEGTTVIAIDSQPLSYDLRFLDKTGLQYDNEIYFHFVCRNGNCQHEFTKALRIINEDPGNHAELINTRRTYEVIYNEDSYTIMESDNERERSTKFTVFSGDGNVVTDQDLARQVHDFANDYLKQ